LRGWAFVMTTLNDALPGCGDLYGYYWNERLWPAARAARYPNMFAQLETAGPYQRDR